MRVVFYCISLFGLLFTYLLSLYWPGAIFLLVIFVPYILIGVYDICATKHTVLRNYPVIGHLRYILEFIRPELQQYFIESDKNGSPYSREIRSLIYQRAKGVSDSIPFGTKNNLTEEGYMFSYHSLYPKEVLADKSRIIIGGIGCKKPYNSSLLNISGMSFGALSPNAIRALNKGALIGKFAHNTGEGGMSHYHIENGGDLVWQIGTGYFGCRNQDGTFNQELFKKYAIKNQVKMIELKLSQGAKPAHGGILPAVKVTEEIANIRVLKKGEDAISPPMFESFSTPIGLLKFIQKLRELSGGKPVGFKLCLGNKIEFMAICKAMISTGIKPDFITVDGAEGGTGAAPVTFTNRLGTPINEAISFVHNCLVGAGLRNNITLIASGKVATGYDLVTKIALGADICNAARAMLFAIGCIQSLSCNTDKCPTGVATQDKKRWYFLDVKDKSARVASYHEKTIDSFLALVGALGISSPQDLNASHIRRYKENSASESYDIIYPKLSTGALLEKNSKAPYIDLWNQSDAKRF